MSIIYPTLTPVSRLPLEEGASFYKIRTGLRRINLNIKAFVRKIFRCLACAFKLLGKEKLSKEKFPTRALFKNDPKVKEAADRMIKLLEKSVGKDELTKLAKQGDLLLVVVDPQKDFNLADDKGCKDGDLGLKDGRFRNAVAGLVLKHIFKLGGHTVLTGDWHPKDHISFVTQHPGEAPYTGSYKDKKGKDQTTWPEHCIQGKPGAEFDADISHYADYVMDTVPKGTDKGVEAYSAMADVEETKSKLLPGILANRKPSHVVVCGNAYDVCAETTATHLAEKISDSSSVKKVFFLREACAPVFANKTAEADQRLEKAGVTVL